MMGGFGLGGEEGVIRSFKWAFDNRFLKKMSGSLRVKVDCTALG